MSPGAGTQPVSKNAKTALILATIALIFFFGFIAKFWLLGAK